MKVLIVLLLGLAALAGWAFTNGEPSATNEPAPPAATEATSATLPSATCAGGAEQPSPALGDDPALCVEPSPSGDIGTAYWAVCHQGDCTEFEAGPHNGLYLINGRQVEYWWNQARRAERRVEKLLATKQRLLARVAAKLAPTAQEEYAIHLASIAYEQSERDMLRVADCESGLYAGAYNGTTHVGEHATGLFQFLPSTWRSTPYGHLNIYEPLANALAAGWMWTVGRRGEWACR